MTYSNLFLELITDGIYVDAKRLCQNLYSKAVEV